VQPEDLLAIKTVADVQLSPDGRRIAYTVTEIDAAQDENRAAIWVVRVDGRAVSEHPVQFTRGPKRDTAPRWSPDGSLLAFLSDRESEDAQLYVIPADGGEARQLTALERGAGPAVWSPDGRHIVFEARVYKETPPKESEARERWKQRPRVVTRAQYKADGQGYTFDVNTHLFIVPVDGGEPRQITRGDFEHRAPSWSPDGRQIAFARSRGGPADYSLLDIWTLPIDVRPDGQIETGEPRRITETVGRATSPTWSPDGRTIACYGTDEQEPGFGEPLVRVWLVSAEGGAARRLTADYDRGVVLLPPPANTPGPAWSSDGTSVAFIAADAGNAHVVRASVPDGAIRPVVTGERQVTSASFALGRVAFCATQPDNPGDVYVAGDDGEGERRLTRVNEALLSGLAWPRVERRTFAGPNGASLEGWLYRPQEGAAPAPLMLHIHGGPHSFAGNAYLPAAFYSYVLASRGWAVLMLNFSGSGSYGKAFAHRLRGRWGEYDLPEQLAAIDALIADGIADGDRLAVCGYSYGGYMTSWTITHTNRFQAAVVGAPVTNLESFFGTSDIGMWFAPWEMTVDLFAGRETYRRLSPIHYADRVTTPTLILHGEADDRCPIEQGEQLYIALVAAGRAPVEFVRYPGGAHPFVTSGRPSHRLDFTRRVVEWVERHTLR
jgi:dipeptidyl aminopeptidase/acylaminoacyl peptidase